MTCNVQFFGAAGEVTGSCHLVTVCSQKILLDCGLIQGDRKDEARNRRPFPFEPKQIDAVVLSHAHIDHSGHLALLVKAGFRGPIDTHRASRDLCRIMLKDAGFLSEKVAISGLSDYLDQQLSAPVHAARTAEVLDLGDPGKMFR